MGWKVKKTIHEDNANNELNSLKTKIEKVRQLNRDSYKDLVREIQMLTKSKLQSLKKKRVKNQTFRKNKKNNRYSKMIFENENRNYNNSTTEDAIETILSNYRNSTPPPPPPTKNAEDEAMLSEWHVLSDAEEDCCKSNEASDDCLDSGSVASGGKLPASFLLELENKLKQNNNKKSSAAASASKKGKNKKVGKKKRKRRRKFKKKNAGGGFAFGNKFNEAQFQGIQMKLDRMIIQRVDDFVPIASDEELIASYDFCEINEEPEIPVSTFLIKNFDESMDIIKNQKFKLKKTKRRKGKKKNKEKEFRSASEIALQQIF